MELPFNLPDLLWWQWALIAAGGGFLAYVISKFSDQYRLAGFVSVVIAVLASMIGVLAIWLWASS